MIMNRVIFTSQILSLKNNTSASILANSSLDNNMKKFNSLSEIN